MTIQLAITNFQVIEIEYVSVQQKASKRKIEPFAFYNNKGNWLLVAFCQLRNEFHAFRIDLIEKLIVQNDNFEPHNMTIQEYFERYVKK